MRVRHRSFLLSLGLFSFACVGERRDQRHQAIVSDAGLVRGPYLQIGAPTSAIVRWRTITASESRVNLGTTPGELGTTFDVLTPTLEHQVTLEGLTPSTRYYYSVGSPTREVASAPDQFFVTPPLPGTQRPVRIWAIGDSGTGNADAARVRDAYRAFTGGMTKYSDVWLMLGDNAYPNGEDESYQRAVFEMYPMFLRQTFLWPTIGNHDTHESSNPPHIPYLDIFTLPTRGEAGGLPSGTERYYSFDFADVHFICLDSMTSDRTPTGAMMTWLEADLRATTRSWIIAFWHHPPYSKGNHDSDYQPELVEMRRWALPILERHGVDLVLSGHSHTYERSFLMDGHYGLSSTLEPTMKKDPGSGRAGEGTPYRKPTTGKAANEGAVYVVAGNAGWLSPVGQHPAVFLALSRLGSLVVDIDGSRLDARFLRDTAFIDDTFTILKGPQQNQLPRVRIASPADESTATSARVAVTAEASDPDGTIAKVEFFADTLTPIGSDQTAPFEATWSATEGIHQLSAVATDDRGATVLSTPVTIIVPREVGGAAAPMPDAAPAGSGAGDVSPGDASATRDGGAIEAPVDAPVDAPIQAVGGSGPGDWRHRGGERFTSGCGLGGGEASPAWALLLVLGALAHELRRARRGRPTRPAPRAPRRQRP